MSAVTMQYLVPRDWIMWVLNGWHIIVNACHEDCKLRTYWLVYVQNDSDQNSFGKKMV